MQSSPSLYPRGRRLVMTRRFEALVGFCFGCRSSFGRVGYLFVIRMPKLDLCNGWLVISKPRRWLFWVGGHHWSLRTVQEGKCHNSTHPPKQDIHVLSIFALPKESPARHRNDWSILPYAEESLFRCLVMTSHLAPPGKHRFQGPPLRHRCG